MNLRRNSPNLENQAVRGPRSGDRECPLAVRRIQVPAIVPYNNTHLSHGGFELTVGRGPNCSIETEGVTKGPTSE